MFNLVSIIPSHSISGLGTASVISAGEGPGPWDLWWHQRQQRPEDAKLKED